MAFTPEQTKMLAAPLDIAHVKKPSGSFGPKGDYLEGWHVINELNRVFGFDGWSYSIDLTRDALGEVEVEKNGAKSKQWQAAYTCICTLTVGATVRQDVGFGSGFAKLVGDAVEGATKEAATDALKRCARTFGNIFGLALYDKSRANVAESKPDSVTLMEGQINGCSTIIQLTSWKRDHGQAANATGWGDHLVGIWNARKAEVEKMDQVAA